MFNPTVFREDRPVANLTVPRLWGREDRPAARLRPALLAGLAAAVVLSLASAPEAARAERRKPEEVSVKTPVYHVSQSAFHAGERWSFDFRWSGIPVGRFAIELTDSDGPDGKRLNIDVTGRTNSFIDLLWRYRLHATGWVFTEPFAPGAFHSQEQENSKHKSTDVTFDSERRVRAIRKKGDSVHETEFPAPNTYDILSAVFLVMSLDHKVGEEYFVDTLTGTARYLVTIAVEEKGAVEVAGESVEAFRLLLHSYDLTDPDRNSKHTGTSIWVSAAKPKRLLMAESKTFVGSIYGRLTAVEPVGEESRPPAHAEAGDAGPS